jgi:hypothetical protein
MSPTGPSMMQSTSAPVVNRTGSVETPFEPDTSNVIVPFEVVLQTATESITAAGRLHVTTSVRIVDGGTFLTVHTNLLDTTGLGQTSGAAFRISSTGTTTYPNLPDVEGVDISALMVLVLIDASRSGQEDFKDLIEKQRKQQARVTIQLHFISTHQFIVTVDHPPPCELCTR